MAKIHLDGEQREIPEGTRLSSLVPDHPAGCAIGIIRPATQEQSRTDNIAIDTTAGEVTVEAAGEGAAFLTGVAPEKLVLHWGDRYAAAFGPFSTSFQPARKPHLYERGDVILGCGGYDPSRSYLIFSRSRHSADHGAAEGGGIIGRVISGRAIIDRWTTGDAATKIVPVVSWADTSRSFTTTDKDLVLEDGMQIVTHMAIVAQGFTPEKINTAAAGSVEHLLLALQRGKFVIGRATSTHILDPRFSGVENIPRDSKGPRREGTVTVRTEGKTAGGVYIYRADIPSSLVHSVVGQVVHGIALARIAKEGDEIAVQLAPRRIDLLGLPLARAQEIAQEHGITLVFDKDGSDRIIVSQEPGTTLDVLAEKKVTVTTAPLDKVIDIELDDARAPASCEVFRRFTGLKEHDAGMMPVFFKFDDVVLFKPEIAPGTKITPENIPVDESPAAALGITNDSRKGAGLVGVRLSENTEFGPTSEPFEGTNLIGRVIDTEKLKKLREKETVYIREVRK